MSWFRTADSEYAEHAVPPCSIAALKHSNINPLSLSWICFIVQIPETWFEGRCWCDMMPVCVISVWLRAACFCAHNTRSAARIRDKSVKTLVTSCSSLRFRILSSSAVTEWSIISVQQPQHIPNQQGRSVAKNVAIITGLFSPIS